MRLSEGINDTLPSPTLPERRKWKRVFARKIVTGTRSPERGVPKNLGVRSVQNYASSLGWLLTFPGLCIHSPTVYIYVNKRGNKKLYKLYTNPIFCSLSRWISKRCEMYSLRRKLYTNYTLNHAQNPTLRRSKPYTAHVQNPTQRAFKTLHNGIQNPTQRAFKTLHSERSQNYTRSGTQTLHFVFEHESREWNEWTRMNRP